MNRSMQDDFKRDGLVSQLVKRVSELEAFEREFRLKQFIGGVLWLPFGVYINLSPMTASPSYPYLVTIDRSMTLVRYTLSVFVGVPNDGANYWTLLLRTHPGATTLNTITTASIAATTWTQITDTTFPSSSVGTSDIAIVIECTKTAGAPGNLFLAGPLLEVTV